jgi:CRISPR-associated DxTHG motif protein
MLVFVTPEAREKAYPTLAALSDPRIEAVDIPRGETSDGMWQIFNRLVEQIHTGDVVIFDITHGLRSIPFLMFLAAAYLRSAKDVTIRSILYGALELRGPNEPAPVIDLSEFVSLLDWLAATNLFIKTGNATDLATELGRMEAPTFKELADTVEAIAGGLHLLRPFDTSLAAATLTERLGAIKPEQSPPFAVLSDYIAGFYSQFGQAGQSDPRAHLGYQLKMINWYHHRSQVVHTLSLSREWVISLLCWHFDVDALNKGERDEMELLLNGGVIKRGNEVIRESKYNRVWSTVPDGKRLRRLWGGQPCHLANLRNDVLHAGFRPDPSPPGEVLTQTRQIVEEINQIAAAWGLSGEPMEAP